MADQLHEMNVDIKTINGISVMKWKDNINIYNAPAFRAAIDNLIAQNRISVILNLEEVLYIDSSGLGVLITCMKLFAKIGGRFKIGGLSEPVQHVFKIMQSRTLFEIYDTEAEAVKSFNDD